MQLESGAASSEAPFIIDAYGIVKMLNEDVESEKGKVSADLSRGCKSGEKFSLKIMCNPRMECTRLY